MDINPKQKPSKEPKKFNVFPEWIDAEINAEKWDLGLSRGAKPDAKTAQKSSLELYEDPDGLITIPSSLKVAYWKRLGELFSGDDKEPVVAAENNGDFDFIKPNIHLFVSEFTRNLISQIIGLVKVNKIRPIIHEPMGNIFIPTESTPWRPWHHVYCNCKAGKIPHRPVYNIYGKYIVRLYLLGCWRKIYVDDLMPFDAENRLLLPTTGNKYEIWPMILFKAFFKLGYVQSINYSSAEVEFFCIVTSLTGWQPEHRKIFKCHPEDLWNVLNRCLPKYKFPEEKQPVVEATEVVQEKVKQPKKSKKSLGQGLKVSLRESRTNMKVSTVQSQQPSLTEINDLIYNPQLVMCVVAVIRHDRVMPARKEELREMDAILKRYYLCSSLSTTVFLNQIRDCTLEPPTPAEEIPKYKQIRRYLWDPTYNIRGLGNSPKIESILIEPTGRWSDYRYIEKSKEKDILAKHKHKTVPEVLKVLEKLIISVTDEPIPEYKEASLISERKSSEDKDFWIDLKEFCKCFGSIVIFHNTSAYNHYYKAVDQRLVTSEGPFSKERRQQKDVTNTQIVLLPNKDCNFLLCDYVSPKILFLSLQSLRDIYPETVSNESDEIMLPVRGGKKPSAIQLESKSDFPFGTSTVHIEEYFFKILIHSHVLLNLKSPFGRGIGISLPEGRTVLRVRVTATNPCVLYMWSSTPFFYGDEDLILPKLVTESQRFISTATSIFNQFTACFDCYDNPFEFKLSILRLRGMMFPHRVSKKLNKIQLTNIFNAVFYSFMENILEKTFNPDIFFTLRCFTLDATTPHLFKNLKYAEVKSSFRKISASSYSNQQRRSRLKSDGKTFRDAETSTPECGRQIEYYEHTEKIIFIQSLVRRLIARRMLQTRIAGTRYNILVTTIILKMLDLMEKNPEENAIFFLRTLVQISSTCAAQFPFYEDEKQRISYQEFTGVIPAMTPYSWQVIFRDIFYCKKSVELVPRLYIDRCNCSYNVTIINNDNLETTPLLFLQPQHFRYVPNNSGYSIIIEAASKGTSIPECKWKLRIITGTSMAIHYASKDIPGSMSFSVRDYPEYYVPNKHNRIARFNIKCFADSLITIQYFSSNRNAVFTANLYKNNELIKTIKKKGMIIFPAILMRETELPKGDHLSNSSICSSKLLLEVFVKPNTWLVPPEDSSFLIFLQLRDRAELNVFDAIGLTTGEDTERISSATSLLPPVSYEKPITKKTKAKGNASEGKIEDILSGHFHFSKPYYIMRVVVDTSAVEFIKTKKDTGYLEEFRAMKRAWEEADPGRAAQGLRARRDFLLKFMDLPPPEEDPYDYRRAIDHRLANDIRIQRQSIRKFSESSDKTNFSGISSSSVISPFTAFPPTPITIIPLKKFEIEQFIRRSDHPKLKGLLIERQLAKQQQMHERYQKQQEERYLRQRADLDIRNTEKIVLMERFKNRLRERTVNVKYCSVQHTSRRSSKRFFDPFS